MVKRKKKKSLNKEQASRAHFRRRAWQRFELTLSRDDIEDAVAKIKRGESVFVSKQSNTRTLHKVTVGDKEVIIVYDKNRKVPVTALRQEYLSNGH